MDMGVADVLNKLVLAEKEEALRKSGATASNKSGATANGEIKSGATANSGNKNTVIVRSVNKNVTGRRKIKRDVRDLVQNEDEMSEKMIVNVMVIERAAQMKEDLRVMRKDGQLIVPNITKNMTRSLAHLAAERLMKKIEFRLFSLNRGQANRPQ